MRLYPTKS